MGIADSEEKTPPKRRLPLDNSKLAMASLARLIRSFYNNELAEGKFKALVYGMGKLLEYDKYALESEMTKRLDALEQAVKGTGNTVIAPNELDNPYTTDLKQRLAETEQVKSSIEQRLLETERELKLLRSQIGENE